MIYLASKSPRRKEILNDLTISFECVQSSFEEIYNEDPFVLLKNNACGKAYHTKITEGVILGMDTIGLFENTILEKPKDKEDAYRMLRMLSGETHSIFTGSCFFQPEINKEEYFLVETKVTFYDLSDEEIWKYIETGEPMDKAAAYGIQDRSRSFVKSIEGDYWNVVGFPTKTMREVILKAL